MLFTEALQIYEYQILGDSQKVKTDYQFTF